MYKFNNSVKNKNVEDGGFEYLLGLDVKIKTSFMIMKFVSALKTCSGYINENGSMRIEDSPPINTLAPRMYFPCESSTVGSRRLNSQNPTATLWSL